MKVLLISPYPPPTGGIASWTKRVLQTGLPGDWKIVHINSNMLGGRDPFKNTKISIKNEFKRTIKIWQKELRELKDKEIKVVHTCIPCTLFGMIREIVTGIIAKACGRKFILHCRCTVPNVVNSKKKVLIFKVLTYFCDGIMVLNQKSYDFTINHTKAIVRLIPNFVSDSEFIDLENKIYSNKIENILYVGGVTSDKGCDVIIKAASQLPEIKFHLLGNVSDEIQNMCKTDNVILYGNREKLFVQQMYEKSDMFLFLSCFWGEGFSNALVEAMSSGLPCIVSDWAANGDMIGNDGGVIIDGKSEVQLVDAIRKYSNNKLIRKKMGTRNARVTREKYCESVVLGAYVDMYNELNLSK